MMGLIKTKDKNNAYIKLLEEIKKSNTDDNYKPKNYKFGLNNFDEKGNEKK